jgi:hypothetical protein
MLIIFQVSKGQKNVWRNTAIGVESDVWRIPKDLLSAKVEIGGAPFYLWPLVVDAQPWTNAWDFAAWFEIALGDDVDHALLARTMELVRVRRSGKKVAA